MTFVNTRRLFFAVDRHPACRLVLRWGFWHWQGCVFRSPVSIPFMWFGDDGDRWLQIGRVVFAVTGLELD